MTDSALLNPTGRCPLCEGDGDLLHPAHPGYQEGSHYAIHRCRGCGARWAWPLTTDPSVYQRIYENAEVIPGYNRYSLFASRIAGLRGRAALQYLAGCDPTYHPFLSLFPEAQPGRRVLEIGCGLGYLTYALCQAGCNTTGVDISANAVEQATRRFGPHYRICDILKEDPGLDFDTVILTEVIEHVEDPILFLKRASAFLKPRGELIITTPNREFPPFANQIWETEKPPVHLWWFGQESMTILGEKIGCSIELFDYTVWNRLHFSRRLLTCPPLHLPERSTLKADGTPFSPATARHRKDSLARKIRSRLLAFYHRDDFDATQSPILFAICKKRPQESTNPE